MRYPPYPHGGCRYGYGYAKVWPTSIPTWYPYPWPTQLPTDKHQLMCTVDTYWHASWLNFMSSLKDHLLSQLLNLDFDADEWPFTLDQWNKLWLLNLNCVVESKTLRVNYTTYLSPLLIFSTTQSIQCWGPLLSQWCQPFKKDIGCPLGQLVRDWSWP